MPRIIVHLKSQEHNALSLLAEREFRDPRAQAALLIRLGLEKARMLPDHTLDHEVDATTASSAQAEQEEGSPPADATTSSP